MSNCFQKLPSIEVSVIRIWPCKTIFSIFNGLWAMCVVIKKNSSINELYKWLAAKRPEKKNALVYIMHVVHSISIDLATSCYQISIAQQLRALCNDLNRSIRQSHKITVMHTEKLYLHGGSLFFIRNYNALKHTRAHTSSHTAHDNMFYESAFNELTNSI